MIRRLLTVVVAVLALPAAAAAQTPRVSIGTIASEQTCTTYQLSEGRSSLVANRYGIAAASS